MVSSRRTSLYILLLHYGARHKRYGVHMRWPSDLRVTLMSRAGTTVKVGHVWTAPLRQVLIWRGDDCGRGAVMCLACWCSHSSRLLALMWFARWVLITNMGSTP